MFNFFRTISIVEGLSFLVILSVTIGVIPREYVFMLGMGHGVLFMIYFVVLCILSHKMKWSVIIWLLLLMAALVPFAFLAVEVYLRKVKPE